jgi:CRISPR/Cas system CSM-associated protein Csm3 (group 7 of RAMP superfamily)
MRINYKIEFYSYWHSGSGLSIAAGADLRVNKDKDGLPFIPGKTLKGLLREAAENLLLVNPEIFPGDFIKRVFGEKLTPDTVTKNLIEAESFFSNAQLTDNLKNKIIQQKGMSDFLYDQIYSTAIEENGLAKEGSLRQMEVTIPLELFAGIENFPKENEYLESLMVCMNWVKRLGVNRNRGLGRCKIEILN